jgi:hypothetical protein
MEVRLIEFGLPLTKYQTMGVLVSIMRNGVSDQEMIFKLASSISLEDSKSLFLAMMQRMMENSKEIDKTTKDLDLAQLVATFRRIFLLSMNDYYKNVEMSEEEAKEIFTQAWDILVCV